MLRRSFLGLLAAVLFAPFRRMLSPAAATPVTLPVTSPVTSLSTNPYIRGPRYRVMFDRTLVAKYTKDSDELRTWSMDIRQVLADNYKKDTA